MEPNEVEQFQKEISTKIRLPKEEKYKIYGKMFINLLLAVAVLVYFIFLNLGYLKLDTKVFKVDLKVFAVILLGFTIYFFERAYTTGRGTYVVHSLELLVLSLVTLYMPYVYFYQNELTQIIFSTSAVYIGIYYIIKCICMYIIYRNRYIHKASDVRELLKEEKVSYLDEESTKKFTDNNKTKSPRKTTKTTKKTAKKAPKTRKTVSKKEEPKKTTKRTTKSTTKTTKSKETKTKKTSSTRKTKSK